MILSVDVDSPVPPFEQIRSQIAQLAASGALPAGTRLPAIRQLSADLGLAPGTVGRAYHELELSGIVSARGRHGSFIAGPQPAHTSQQAIGQQPAGADRASQLRRAAADYERKAAELGVSPAEAVRVLQQLIAGSQPTG